MKFMFETTTAFCSHRTKLITSHVVDKDLSRDYDEVTLYNIQCLLSKH